MGGPGTEAPTHAGLEPVAARLRSILEPYASRLIVRAGAAGELVLERAPGGHPWDYVAGVRVGRRYVSYYLMPVYARPDLVEALSPELRRRMQGKSCFNFTKVDERLFSELADLTRRGIEGYLALPAPERKR